MTFFQHIQQATKLAEEQGFALKITLLPINPQNTGVFTTPPSPETIQPTEKGDLSIVLSPLIDQALGILGIQKSNPSISPDIVYDVFELIRNESERLLPNYEKLKSQFDGRVLHTSIARIIAEKLGLRNKGKRVIVENNEALIGSYTQIHR